jgi:pheromone shutdown protein TraB
MLEERDALVVQVLEQLPAEYAAEPVTVAVVYGAGHVPGIARAMVSRLGYHASSARWLTVFDI